MMKSFLLSPIFVLAFFLMTRGAIAQEQVTRVAVYELQETTQTRELELSGTLRSLRNAQLSVAVSSLVQGVHADIGHHVKKGDVLITLDSQIMAAEYERAQAQLQAAEIAFSEAQRLYKEAKTLRKQNHIGESEVKALENAERLASAQLAQARAESQVTQSELEHHSLLAPFDGVVSVRNTELGQWLEPGDHALTLVSLDQVYLDVQLPQEYLGLASNISSVTLQLDTHTGLDIPAQVETLVPIGESARSFLLRLRPTEGLNTLFPGASATARIVFAKSEQAILLPRDALLRNVDGKFSVFVVEQNQAVRRSVKLGATHKANYWVESGLAAGEQVVVRGNELLSDGQAVAVVESTADAL